VLDGVVVAMVAVLGTATTEDAMVKALVLGARALAGEELLCPAATLLALLPLARSVAT
jgi:hypothetical protein